MKVQRGMQIGPFDLLPPQVGNDEAATEHHAPLLQDLNHKHLLGDISRDFGVYYLSEVTGPRQPPYSGILWSTGTCLPLVWLPCKLSGKTRCVFFLVDTGAPATKMCRQAFEAFQLENPPHSTNVSINGTTVRVERSDSTGIYSDINLLGADFLRATQSVLTCNYSSLTCGIQPSVAHNQM
jgi:hypothetical protein